VLPGTPATFGKLIADEKWVKVIKFAGGTSRRSSPGFPTRTDHGPTGERFEPVGRIGHPLAACAWRSCALRRGRERWEFVSLSSPGPNRPSDQPLKREPAPAVRRNLLLLAAAAVVILEVLRPYWLSAVVAAQTCEQQSMRHFGAAADRT
jgi:hypothetical protein